MKKRWIGLMLAVWMAVLPACLAGADTESVLLQKMQKQIDAGSGLKGTVTLSGLTGFDGLQLDVGYIKPKAQSQLKLTLLGSGQELIRAALYRQDQVLALDAGLLSGKLYRLPGSLESLLGGLVSGKDNGQTTLYTAIAGLLFPKDEESALLLAKAAAPYLTKADLWMQGFAATPVLEKDPDGASVMKVSYSIPAAAFKAEIKQLLVDLLNDKTLLPLLWEQMDSQQADLYLNPALQSFYFQAIDSLPLDGEIAMLRRVTITGELLETSLSLPLAESIYGLKSLSFSSKASAEGDITDITLGTAEGSLELSSQKISEQTDAISYRGSIRYLPKEIPNWQVDATAPKYAGKALLVSYLASYKTEKQVEADGKNSEIYTLTVDLAPEWGDQVVTDEVKAQYVLTEPAKITASLKLISGQARNSATYLSALIQYTAGETVFQLTGEFKTTPPWTFSQVDMAAVESLSSLTPDQQNAMLIEILGKPAFLPLLPYLLPSDLEIPGTVG